MRFPALGPTTFALALASYSMLSAAAIAQERPGSVELREHNVEFKRDVIRVSDGVFVAVGYAASNVILLQGVDGVVILDTAPNPTEARAIQAAFAKVSKGPVRAIIYTHSHPDHTGGARIFAGEDKPQIIAGFDVPPQAIGRPNQEGADQFGMRVPDELYINAGTQLEFGRNVAPTNEGYLPPTRKLTAKRESIVLAGLQLELLATPGEAGDSISVWWPAQRVIATGDAVLKSFPNIAPIRGVPVRPPEQWVDSLNEILALEPAALIPGHMRPVVGAANVASIVTAYRDGIKSVNDQTLAGMKRGVRPDQLVQTVQLPPELREHPYLRQYYGTVEWMVRGIYAGQLGWFDGRGANVFPLTLAERAGHLLPLIGGPVGAVEAGRAASAVGNHRWALELADLVIAVDPANLMAKRLKFRALTELGKREGNAIARNWYLSVATQLEKEINTDQ